MAKRAFYKGVPLTSATLAVDVPRPFRLFVGVDPSWGKKIFLESSETRKKAGLTREEIIELAQRLHQAAEILDDIEISDGAVPELQLRVDRLQDKNGTAWADLQDMLDSAVHDLASREASAQNNAGADDQVEYLVMELGKDEVERMIVAAEELQEAEDNGE
jgi:hypothetical protein